LESWKEIAAYLRRDVRTVQRWHDRAGLPVRRHQDPKQRAVFALRAELDEWRGRSRIDSDNSPPAESTPVIGPRRVWAVAIAVVICAATAAVAWKYHEWRRFSSSERVTTKSPTALELFERAEDAVWIYHVDAARVLYEDALREDPDFALAHVALASVLADGRHGTLVKEHIDRAVALSNQASGIERLRILAQAAEIQGHLTDATAYWEALVRLDPENGKFYEMLAFSYLNTGRIREGTAAAERASALRPSDFRLATYAAQAWALSAGDYERARPYADRARALWPAASKTASSEPGPMNLPPTYARDVAWVLFFPAYDRYRAADIPGTLAEVRRVVDADPLPSPLDRDAVLTIAGAFEMSAGRLEHLRHALPRESQESLRHTKLAVVADVVDDFQTLHDEMLQVPIAGEMRALRYVRAGLYPQAEQILARGSGNAGFFYTASGELALRRGQVADAIPLLQRGITAARRDTLSERYLGAESLADALERLGRKSEALDTLELAAADFPRYTRTGPSGAFWLRVLRRLARAYRERGRESDARAVEDRLKRFLVMADPDHPLLH
jgi:tetratricopeptide (TPR) repeat protein